MLSTARRLCWHHAGQISPTISSSKATKLGFALEGISGSDPRTCVSSRKSSVAAEASVLVRETDGVGFITLNRPKALNALSLDMIRLMTPQLKHWKKEGKVKAVVVR